MPNNQKVDNGVLPAFTTETEVQGDGSHRQVVKIGNTVSVGATSYGLRYDEGATYTYIGEALPGDVTSAASWRIKRLTNADNTIVWADGDSDFDNIWDNRASLSYS